MAGGLAVALIGLIVGLYVSARSARTQQEASELVSHTLEVVGEVDGLVAGTAEAVRNQRYYLFSGDEDDLAPMYAAEEAARQRLRRLVLLTRDYPVQQTRLVELDTLLARRFRLLDSVVRVRREGGLEAARRSLLALGGRAIGTWVDTVAARVRTHEESLLAVRQASLDRAVRQTRTGLAVTGVLVLVLTGATYWGLARLAGQRRRAQEQRDRAFTLSQDMICTADFEGRFVELNPAWERTLGYRLEEMLGRPYLDLVHPDDRERTAAETARQQREGTRTMSFVNRYRHRDGSYRVLHWTAAPYEAERVVYAIARDITELHQAQEELRQGEEHARLLNEELQQSVDELSTVNQELEAFTYSVSHDLRAPLRHISGFSELLEKHVGGALDEKGKRYLLGNALKYTRPREDARIEVGTDAPRDGRAVVFVRDNGVGFDMRYAGKLFGVFERLHVGDEFEGTGIGLATVQRIVHKHCGLVWAEGAVDKGATFYLALPPADSTAASGVT